MRCVYCRNTLLCIAVSFATAGCDRQHPHTVLIDDPARTNQFTVVSESTTHRISGLTLHFQGQIDGTAYVWAANWSTQALSGNVDWSIYHDWFENDCTIHYQPSGVHTGSLKFQYEFH
jgi:hypothetical protein